MTSTQEDRHDNGAGKAGPLMARKIRTDLTAAELERLERYGSVDFASAGATRKR